MSESGDQPVLYEERDSVAVVTLNRPEVRNAQNSPCCMRWTPPFTGRRWMT